MSKKSDHINQAVLLMRSQHSGVLSTQSLSMEGYPFGSIVPFLMTEAGDCVIYASDIAQHSRNMKKDSKVSLCVYDSLQKDSQASPRITIMGTSDFSADAVDAQVQSQYMSVFPQAKNYRNAHDFRFYLISTQRVRYIGGFGEIYWFSQQDWQSHMFPLASSALGAISHMHEDHRDALALIVEQQLARIVTPGKVIMLTCFQHGFHYSCTLDEVMGNNQVHIGFVSFTYPISENHSLRHAMVDLTNHAKKSNTVSLTNNELANKQS